MLSKWPCTENPSRNANLLQLRLTLRGVSRRLVGRLGPYFELRARNDPLRTFNLIFGNPGGSKIVFAPYQFVFIPFPTTGSQIKPKRQSYDSQFNRQVLSPFFTKCISLLTINPNRSPLAPSTRAPLIHTFSTYLFPSKHTQLLTTTTNPFTTVTTQSIRFFL